MGQNRPRATRLNRWADLSKVEWSHYKLSEPRPFSESEEVIGYLLIEKKISTYYIVVRTAWFEHDQRWETQAFPADNSGKPLELLDLFSELRTMDHDQLVEMNGYEVKISGD